MPQKKIMMHSPQKGRKKQRRNFEMMLLLFLFEENFISSLKILYTMLDLIYPLLPQLLTD